MLNLALDCIYATILGVFVAILAAILLGYLLS